MEAQDNPFTSILMVGQADPEAISGDDDPAAGSYRLVMGTDDVLYILDETGNATAVAGGGIANPLATDSLWDAAGDLVQGSGANTAAKLSAGTAGMFLKSAGAAAANLWAFPSGHEIDYVEITTSTSHTATSAATATTAISSNAIAYDGSTRIKIEFWCAALEAPAVANGSVVIELYDGASTLGRIAMATTPTAAQFRTNSYGVRFLTPSAATHTYHAKGWVTSGTGVVACSNSTTSYLPAFLRITKA